MTTTKPPLSVRYKIPKEIATPVGTSLGSVMAAKGTPSWWSLAVGDKVQFNAEWGTVSYIGRNQGSETIVRLHVPSQVKVKQARMRELSW